MRENKESQLQRYFDLMAERTDGTCWCRGTGRIFAGDSNCPHGWQRELSEIETRQTELFYLLEMTGKI